MYIWAGIFFYALRIYFAYTLPVTNDEAYYWTWSTRLDLSYFDHPPSVAYSIAFFRLFLHDPLALRMPAIFFHLLASIFILKSLRFLISDPQKLKRQQELGFLIIQLVPAFSMIGVIVLPDSGLYFGISLMLFLCLKIYKTKFQYIDILPLGFSLGFSGLSKYHAFPIAVGLFFATFKRKDFVKWCLSALVASVIVSPVFIWNYKHDFISFRYQSHHGFGDMKFNYFYIIQFLVGLTVFLSPLFLLDLFRKSFQLIVQKNEFRFFILGGSFLLSAIIFYSAIFKPSLPHWIIPAIWLALPFYLIFDVNSIVQKQLKIYAALIYTFLLLFSLDGVQNFIVNAYKGDPKELSELTEWKPLAKAIKDEFKDFSKLTFATDRWYSSAQLSYHLNTYVYSTDSKPSFFLPPPSGTCEGFILIAKEPPSECGVIESEVLNVSHHERRGWKKFVLSTK